MGSGARSFGRGIAAAQSLQDVEEPNNLERVLGEFLADKPFLQSFLSYFSLPFSAAGNVAESAILGLQGRGKEALSRLGSAGENLLDLATPGSQKILGLGTFSEPEDFSSGKRILESAGVPKLGEARLPLIGKVSGRGALGFLLDVVADPLMYTKIGALTKAGAMAEKAGGLAKTAVEIGEDAYRIVGPATRQAQLGQRAFLQMFGRPLIRGERAIEFIESTFNRMKGSALGRKFNVDQGFPALKEMIDEAIVQGRSYPMGARKMGVRLVEESWRIAKERGIDIDDAFLEAIKVESGRPGPSFRSQRDVLQGRIEEGERRILNEQTKTPPNEQKLDRISGRIGSYLQSDEAKLPKFKARTAKYEKVAGRIQKVRADLYQKRIAPIQAEIDDAKRLLHLHEQARPDSLRQAADFAAGGLKEVKDTVKSYIDQGYSPKAAARAARAHYLYGVDKEFAPIGAELLQQQLTLGRVDVGSGAMLQTLNDVGSYYINHRMTHEALAVVRKAGKERQFASFVNRLSAKNPSMMKRLIHEDGGLSEMDAWFKENVPALADVKNVWERNPLRVAVNRAKDTEKVVTASSLWQQAFKMFGKPAEEVENLGWIAGKDALAGTRLQPAGALAGVEGMALPPEIVSALQQVASLNVKGSDSARAIFRLFDWYTKLWKAGQTVAFPEYYARNSITDLYANATQGVFSPSAYARAMKAAVGKMDFEVRTPTGIISGPELMRQLELHDALGGFFEEYLGEAATKAGASKEPGLQAALTLGPPKPKGILGKAADAALKYPRKAGEIQSHVFRIANVIDKLEKGIPLDSAVRSMKNALFDYRHGLTPFERDVMRRLIPFYSFTRFNLPFMLRTAVEKPMSVATVRHIQDLFTGGMTEAGPLDTTYVPEWMTRRLFGASVSDQNMVTTAMGYGIGLEDLAIFDRPVREFIGMMNPLIKATVQWATQHDLYKGQSWDKSATAPWPVRWLPDSVQNLMGVKPVIGDKGETLFHRMDPFYANLLQALPFSRAVNTVSRFDPSDDQAIGDQMLRTFTGLKVGDTDLRVLKSKAMLEAMDEVLKERLAKGEVIKPSIYSVPRGMTDGLTEEQRGRVRENRKLTSERERIAAVLRALNEPKSPGVLRSGGQ